MILTEDTRDNPVSRVGLDDGVKSVIEVSKDWSRTENLFMSVKAFSHSADHMNLTSFLVGLVRGARMREKSLMNLL